MPQTVLRTRSRFNRDIRVNLERGEYKLLVNGARESGEYIRKLWEYAFDTFDYPGTFSPKHIVVFGLAGGTVVHMLRAIHPQAVIIGVDIDRKMIDIGKKYFGLADISDLRYVHADARSYVKSHKGTQFDCAVIDLFVGPDIPDFVVSEQFQNDVRRIVAKDGRVMVNFLREPGYEKKADMLCAILSSVYPVVTSCDRYNNRFFLAHRS